MGTTHRTGPMRHALGPPPASRRSGFLCGEHGPQRLRHSHSRLAMGPNGSMAAGSTSHTPAPLNLSSPYLLHGLYEFVVVAAATAESPALPVKGQPRHDNLWMSSVSGRDCGDGRPCTFSPRNNGVRRGAAPHGLPPLTAPHGIPPPLPRMTHHVQRLVGDEGVQARLALRRGVRWLQNAKRRHLDQLVQPAYLQKVHVAVPIQHPRNKHPAMRRWSGKPHRGRGLDEHAGCAAGPWRRCTG